MRTQTDSSSSTSEPANQNTATPIQYLGGVMDEETRPLLKAYINNLNNGEAALVVFRLEQGESPTNLLESDIFKIAGHDWNFASGGAKEDPMQTLVDNLANDTMANRVPNALFAQGGLKVKAFDSHKVCYGLITKNPDEKITSIKGIVHQQLNMGLNGDLLLHESDIIMAALLENNVFADRPIHIITYGAGGSASIDTNPGDMHISDGVIDIRTHVDPKFSSDFLKNYAIGWGRQNKGDQELLEKISGLCEKIQRKINEDPHYTGIRVVHHIAELSRLVSQFTGVPNTEIIKTMPPDSKAYIAEITFGTPNSGTAVIHRISVDPKTKQPFLGNSGQLQATEAIQAFMTHMAEMDDEAFLSEHNSLIQQKEAVRAEKDSEQAQQTVEVLENKIETIKTYHQAHQRLHKEITADRKKYQRVFNQDRFNITACGNIFFTEEDKLAVGLFGASEVEMENNLFIQIINFAVANQLFIDEEYITKIAADPLLIEKQITEGLNDWAANYTLSLDDYVEAYMWGLRGQNFDSQSFPKSGHWDGAEKLYKEHPDLRKRFYNFGTVENPIIMNPFWKEIATDFLKEIASGAAFSGTAVQRTPPEDATDTELAQFKEQSASFEQAKKNLQEKALAAMQISPNKKNEKQIEASVREVFEQYLSLMKPMQIHDEFTKEVRYRCYARKTKVLPTGFVQQPLDDWDQPFYKSTNTAVLDQQSTAFVQNVKARQIGGGAAMIPASAATDEVRLDMAGTILVQMLKAISKEQNVEKAINLGENFLKKLDWSRANPSPSNPAQLKTPTQLEKEDQVQYLAMVKQIQRLIADDGKLLAEKLPRNPTEPEDTNAAAPLRKPTRSTTPQHSLFSQQNAYPSLMEAYVRRNKLTGPRAAEALKAIKEDHGVEVAIATGEKFMRWSLSQRHDFNLADMKKLLSEFKQEQGKEQTKQAGSP